VSDSKKQTRAVAAPRGKPFAPGHAGGPGRKPGQPNKVTQEFRETVRKLLEDNAGNVGVWLEQVATGSHGTMPAPEKALDLLAKLAEFAAPKLGRVEHVGDGGGPVETVQRIELAPMTKGGE
jgi:hypothetical protein